MVELAKRVVSLAPEDDAFVEAQLRDGVYSSASAIVGAGLKALQAQDAALDDWLMAEVGPVYDAMKADPSRGIPADEVFAALRARHAQRIKDRA